MSQCRSHVNACAYLQGELWSLGGSVQVGVGLHLSVVRRQGPDVPLLCVAVTRDEVGKALGVTFTVNIHTHMLRVFSCKEQRQMLQMCYLLPGQLRITKGGILKLREHLHKVQETRDSYKSYL